MKTVFLIPAFLICVSFYASANSIGIDPRMEISIDLQSLPKDAILVSKKNGHYYYCRGIFYTPTAIGYKTVDGPAGVKLKAIPRAAQKIVVNNKTYFKFKNTFYKYKQGHYVVVKTPRR